MILIRVLQTDEWLLADISLIFRLIYNTLNKTHIIHIRIDSVELEHACQLERAPELVHIYLEHACYLGYLHARPDRVRMLGQPPSEQAEEVRKGLILLALLHLREQPIYLML